jgi:pimeloyl-ACP methyl ester carboxylesterase
MMRTLGLILVLLALVAGIAWFVFGRGGSEPAPEAAIDSPWWSAQDRLVDVDGVTARVRVEGLDDAPVLVMIHGFSFSLESWDDWADALSANYRVVRMDLPGHGLTGPDPQARYSVPQTVEFLGGLMDAMDIDRATLVGNSLGGLVAWRYAADHGDRVEKLVLVAPGGFSINGVTEEPVDVPVGVRFYLTQGPQPVVAGATAALFGDPTRMDPDLPARVHGLMQGEGVGEAMVQRLEVFTLPAPEADLARVTVPALILWGGRDAMVPVDHAARFEAAMPDVQLVVYDDLGHIPHEEAPERTLEDVRAFLSAN